MALPSLSGDHMALDAASQCSQRDWELETEAGYVNIQTKPWEYFSDRTIRLRDRLRLEIKQSTPARDGQLRYAEEKGSDSVIDVRNQHVLKLITPVRLYDDFDIRRRQP